MKVESFLLCEHGYVRTFAGTAEPGERLPEIEFCPVCDEHTTPLKDSQAPR